MNRRAFLSGAAALLAAPLAAEAQPASKTYRIGVLWHADNREGEGLMFDALITGLRERGYVEGRNITLEHRFAGEVPERFRRLAAELVALKRDVLVGVSPPSAVALKDTGTSIPIVFTAVGDAVVAGLVPSVARPGENITGFTILTPQLTGKRLEMLLEILPGTKRVGVLYNPDNPLSSRILREVASATQTFGLASELAQGRTAGEIDRAFAQFSRNRIKAVLTAGDPLLWFERHRIARLALRAGIAETQAFADGADAGPPFSYGASLPEVVRQSCDYVVRILLGARPRDLPVMEPSRFELVINLKTAKALGLTIPPAVLVRADRVIE